MTRLPIAKIPVRAAAVLGSRAEYEWFYVEVSRGEDSLVGIFSLVDPFRREAGHMESSLYLTWHRGGEVEDYAYAIFEGEASESFRERVVAFFTRANDSLELAVPSHARGHDLALWLAWSEDSQSVPPRSTPQHAADFKARVDAAEAAAVRHVWQPLALGRALRGRLFRTGASAREPGAEVRRIGLVHDLPMARRLARNAKRERAFLFDDAIGGNDTPWCYVDHNAGLEPLSGVGESWYWWHARGEASSEASTEIGYWFPRLGDGWLCLPSENITGTDRFSGRDPAKSPWRAPFGVEAARAVTLSSGRDMHFAHMLEAAPFYARLKAVDAAGTHLGTLEALHPRRLRSRLTPFLMACRQTRTTRLGHGYGSRGFLETCRAVTSRNGRSFYLASHVLPESARAGAYFVYTLCRLIDDATDERPAPAGNAEAGSTESAALLDALFNTSNPLHGDTPVVAFVARALAASGGGSPADPVAGRAFALGFLREARLHARALGLERGPFEELVEGQRMDESFGQPGDFAAFYVYCFRVAGVVGLLMARVFGARAAPSTLEAAEHLGIAMQITNILRDVREDWEGRGRVYLPADACARHGVDIATAMGTQKGTPSGSSGGPALVRSLALRAIDYYRSALRGVPDIPSARARLCVRLMAAVYGAILGVILLDPSVPFRRRVVIPQARRLLIAMRVLLGGDPLVAAGLAKTGKD